MQVCIAMGLVMNKADVLFISAELTTEETMGRLLANFSRRMEMPVPNRVWDSGMPDRSMHRHIAPLKKAWIDSQLNGERGEMLLRYENCMDIDSVEGCIQQAKDINPKICAIFIDHLQAIGPFASGKESGHVVIANKVRRLAQLAGQYKVDIFLAAQLNRNANTEEPKKSHIADGYEAVRVAHAMWALDIYKNADGTRDFRRLWLYNLKERTGRQDSSGKDDVNNRYELYGDLNLSYLEQVHS
jgi:replicative DNA helicase